MLAIDDFVLNNQDHWFVREVLGMMRRTFARLDVSSRSMFTFITPGSCFAGTLLELALCVRPRLHAADAEEGETPATVTLSRMNFGALPMVNDLSRLAARFYDDPARHRSVASQIGVEVSPKEADLRLGWSPSRQTSSIGTTKCGRRSSPERPFRPTD